MKDPVPTAAPGGGDALSPISALFKRVVTDEEFKRLLLSDPDEAMADYDLSDTQRLMVKSLEPEDLDKLTPENLEEFFSADAAVYTPDEGQIDEDDEYSAEDFVDLDEEYDPGDEQL